LLLDVKSVYFGLEDVIMSLKKRSLGSSVLFVAHSLFSPLADQAGAAYPEKPIIMIIPYSDGGKKAIFISSRRSRASGKISGDISKAKNGICSIWSNAHESTS
jgi:hypothetical protein